MQIMTELAESWSCDLGGSLDSLAEEGVGSEIRDGSGMVGTDWCYA